jgi:hypothetical protein
MGGDRLGAMLSRERLRSVVPDGELPCAIEKTELIAAV